MIILTLLMALPLLTFSGSDYTAQSGLRELFWFGRSACETEEGIQSFCYNDNWVTKEGWEEKLRHFVMSHRKSVQSDETQVELLWLYIPDFTSNGKMSSIKMIPDQPRNF